MVPTSSPPSSQGVDPSDSNQMMNAVFQALQQQNAALVEQNTITLHNQEAARVFAENARVTSENTQDNSLKCLTSGRTVQGVFSSVIPVQEWNLENFLQHHSARFDGKCSSNEADQWFRDIERICGAKRCPDENEVVYTEYLPYSVRYDLEIEFLQLIPGNRSGLSMHTGLSTCSDCTP
ncbi:uncharacterized protein LOC128194233 [Vigna angularis]|uniref:uncharacterized protein LOC128194233 n=1 Tax=Phaseolus angularis TaxID=3914 RepID=UPI0022B4A662|nr:uncharacterized protein LOC128194233 [Vigna angularis]